MSNFKLPWEDDFEKYDWGSSIRMPMNHKHGIIGYGQENAGKFRKELLDNNITTTFNAIKEGFRTATSRRKKQKAGDLIEFYSKDSREILICLVIKSSYPVSNIEKEQWSMLEGWDVSYFILNPEVVKKYQFIFKLVEVI